MNLCCSDNKKIFPTGCLICGSELHYYNKEIEKNCSICGKITSTSTECENGHFVCDNCHLKTPIEKAEEFLLNTEKRDLIELFVTAKIFSKFPMHGPEYHALIPAVIVTSYKNCSSKVNNLDIKSAIIRGKKIPGGSCGFMGVCGVTSGIGIAISIIIKSTPLKSRERNINLKFCSQVLNEITRIEGPRCCQREAFTGLKFLSKHSKELLGIHLPANYNFTCTQFIQNKECIGKKCTLHPKA